MRSVKIINPPSNPFEETYYNPYQADDRILAQLRECNDIIIRERNSDIKKIETDMELLAEIQQDLSVMIHAQGECIDIAVENIETAEIAISDAVKHIEQASEIQKKTNKLFIGGLLTAAGVAVGGGLVAIASPLAGIVIAGGGIVSGVVMIVVKIVK